MTLHANRLTLVDAGVPTAWKPLHAALRSIGRTIDHIEAIVLTHGHGEPWTQGADAAVAAARRAGPA